MLDSNDRNAMQDALTWFDSLPPVDIDFMIGSWRGSGVPTGHPMDGMLEAANWRGKQFIDADNVHPLVFDDGKGGTFMVNPAIVPLGLAQRLPRKPYITRLFLASRGLIATNRSVILRRAPERLVVMSPREARKSRVTYGLRGTLCARPSGTMAGLTAKVPPLPSSKTSG